MLLTIAVLPKPSMELIQISSVRCVQISLKYLFDVFSVLSHFPACGSELCSFSFAGTVLSPAWWNLFCSFLSIRILCFISISVPQFPKSLL